MSADKHQVLETITAISRLITLAFKPKDTKIAIRDHNVVLCEPKAEKYYGIKIAQGIDRYWNGDSREDIYILHHVIRNFIEWYIIPYRKTEPEICQGLINMARYLCVALRYLQNTYRTGTVVGNLQYYIIVLTAVVEDTYYPDMLYCTSTAERRSFLDDANEDDMIYSTIFDITKFKNFWTKDELKSLCSLFDKCFKLPDEPEHTLFCDESNPDINVMDIKTTSSKKNCAEDHDYENNILGSEHDDDEQSRIEGSAPDSKPTLSTLGYRNASPGTVGYRNASDGTPTTPRMSARHSNYQERPVPLATGTLVRVLDPVPVQDDYSHKKKNIPNKTSINHNHRRAGAPVNSYGKLLPVPRNQNSIMIHGYLVGIGLMLDMMDKRFTSMLNQSVKGTA
jgi:hypothetical protein